MATRSVRAPAGIQVQDGGDKLVLRFKEGTRIGVALLAFAGMLSAALLYVLGGPGPSINEVVGVSVVLGLLVFFGVVNLVNTTTLSVDGEAITKVRGPLSLMRRKQLTSDGVEKVEVEPIESTSSSGTVRYSYAVRVTHRAAGSERLAEFGSEKALAEFVCQAVTARLGLQTEVE